MMDERLCDFVFAWDQAEKRLNGYDVVDCDLTDYPAPAADEGVSRLDLLAAGDALADPAADALGRDSYALSKLRSHLTCLRAICGQRFGITDYVDATQGFRPTPYPEDVLRALRDELDGDAGRLGTTFEAVARNEIADEDRAGPDRTGIVNAFTDALDRYKSGFVDAFGVDLDFNLDFEFVEVDAYWSYWMDGKRDRLRLRFNRSDRTYPTSEVSQLCLHELIGHCGQFHGWRRQIVDGVLPPFHGVTAVHSLEQLHLEGLAQGLPFLLPETEGTLVRLRAKKDLLRQMLLNNCYLGAEQGANVETVFSQYTSMMPVTDMDRLIKDVGDQQRNPVLRTYMFSYPKGFELVHRIGQGGPPEAVKSFIQRSYRAPMAVAEIATLARQYAG